jgi:hypothetical protein
MAHICRFLYEMKRALFKEYTTLMFEKEELAGISTFDEGVVRFSCKRLQKHWITRGRKMPTKRHPLGVNLCGHVGREGDTGPS